MGAISDAVSVVLDEVTLTPEREAAEDKALNWAVMLGQGLDGLVQSYEHLVSEHKALFESRQSSKAEVVSKSETLNKLLSEKFALENEIRNLQESPQIKTIEDSARKCVEFFNKSKALEKKIVDARLDLATAQQREKNNYNTNQDLFFHFDELQAKIVDAVSARVNKK